MEVHLLRAAFSLALHALTHDGPRSIPVGSTVPLRAYLSVPNMFHKPSLPYICKKVERQKQARKPSLSDVAKIVVRNSGN